MFETNAQRLTATRTIGKGGRLTEEIAPLIVASLPADFDPKKRGAVPGAIHTWINGTGEVPAVAKDGVRTDYGRGVDALRKAVTALLNGDDDKPVTLRATLSGEGGGSVTIPTDHPLYEQIVALITEG